MLDLVISQRRRDIGGFEVGRVLPHAARRMVGPFIFFDHLGPLSFAAGVSGSVDVRPHPHIGLATVTYLIEGEIMHRDSVGSEQSIRPGEVNWMVAGSGITHSERFERARAAGGNIHGLQSWVALPKEHEETAPSFAHHAAAKLPQLSERGISLRVLAGAAFGAASPVITHSPLFYLHGTLAAGARLALPQEYPERAVYVVAGHVLAENRSFGSGELLVFAAGAGAEVRAETEAIVMVLGGDPVGQRFIEWNFVSSSKARLEAAKADWRAGRMKLPDLDNAEFIPLPPDPPGAQP